ncbi:thiol-disulfide isomerase [Candidatus Uhrbacteria bacterium CG10_big_fil_rev_8_21_14_0_10_48_11]|uniref:Thiol-disulfide isomerase n=1 Tax=Candidatus Uhrbacteria bacterium CG10_big_fil_rev_8_21_14_0_10_48_11 TaxID=1975037 RepID=A0A2M8LFD2_9BACT|nr:MAG: thiol-disulfide isomerase [Candidatus Uhrbacteria bacterium CG10_big_fil_rev_8_21_14_0_10_48_11]
MRRIILIVVLVAIVGAIAFLNGQKPEQPMAKDDAVSVVTETKSEKANRYKPAKELVDPASFINTDSFQIKDLIGKQVILVDFWTYSCINCQRTLPYVNAWYDSYHDKGLTIIGVHTPEFEFEKEYDNVLAAVKKYDIHYPVVLDNNYGTWRAYGNQYWPRKYLIDIDGYIVYDHIGEGGYDETEKETQKLLAERASRLGEQTPTVGMAEPVNAPQVDFSKVGSPETYFGAARNTYLGNGNAGVAGTQTFTPPVTTEVNKLYLGGSWDLNKEYAKSISQSATVRYRYHAKDVYFVAAAIAPVEIEVYQDGVLVGDANAGGDVTKGIIAVKENQLYHLVHNANGYGEHTLELRVKNSGLEAFTFTFG